MTEQFSAQDPALGYLYQIRYALLLLLEEGVDGQESEIAIERLDDIDIKKDEGKFRLVQTKHHKNPDFLTDACPDLWKTIRIWCSNYKNKKFQVENTILAIVTTGIAQEGSIANMLRPHAFGKRDIETAVEKLIHVAKTSINVANKSAYEIFKSLSKEEQMILVERIEVIDASSTIIDLRKKIINILKYSARKEFINAVYEHIVGWWDELVIGHLYKKSANYISHKLLTNMIDDIREQYFKESLPINVPPPTNVDEKSLDDNERIFIEQLKLVQIKDRRIKQALRDFYRSSSQRSKWIRDLAIPVFELEAYDEKLYLEWEMIFAIMEEDLEDETIEGNIISKGRDFYGEVMKLNFHIRSRCTEEFITRGSYHMLANQLRLGWHLNFKDRLVHLQVCEGDADKKGAAS